MNFIDMILLENFETDKEYIANCKKCFLKEPKFIQEEIENADTDILDRELKRHSWTTTFNEYCRAIKYELMRRNDFKERI